MTLPPSVARAVARSNADLAYYQEIERRKMAKAPTGKSATDHSAAFDKDAQRIRELSNEVREGDGVLADTLYNASRLMQAAAERVRANRKA